MGALADELLDDLRDAAHKTVTSANVRLKNELKSKAPVDDGEVRDGIRVLKKPGGHNSTKIESSAFVKGTNTPSGVSNQQVANATNKRTGWAGDVEGRWVQLVAQEWEKFEREVGD